MTWRGALRRAGRRTRRKLGLPVLSRRVVVLLLLGFLGLALAATIVPDFIAGLGQYRANQYEPKDFQREEHVDQTSRAPKGRP